MHFCQRANKNATIYECLRSCRGLVRLSPKCVLLVATHTANGRYFPKEKSTICKGREYRILTAVLYSLLSSALINLFIKCLIKQPFNVRIIIYERPENATCKICRFAFYIFCSEIYLDSSV